MNNLISRIKSFKNINLTPERKMQFAVAGFYCPAKSKSLDTPCHFCDVELGDWDEEDDPFNEHSKRAEKCPIYNLNTKISRKKTFNDTPIDDTLVSTMVNNGFFLYQLTDDSYDCFCYKCGFVIILTLENEILEQKLQLHHEKCEFNTVKLDDKLFCVELLKGKHNNMLQNIQLPEFELTELEREEFKFLLSLRKTTNPFLKVKDVLSEAIKTANKKIEHEMDKDVKEIRDMIVASD
ncbi:Apoptosis inhibitor IAP1, BIR domain protein [Pseudoloma neurophilia]|uniref:Apoptosis inhibitor IAP1, BIR domain protein n=1 Tax=Pseudoloma neurophilia TaxID=146866 RepID=A0A0R0LWI5_9MICR|nr:Apoptosis inhibitor IAP1, BIR domain protein [Pseudoloma neurophilia]